MNSREFAKTIEKQVAEFCASLDAQLPAYSYIPLTTDEMRIKVMQADCSTKCEREKYSAAG